MSTVELTGVRKEYSGKEVVSDVDLHIAEGEFFSLLGPSGCGKSTTLRMIAGFVPPTSGTIKIGGQDITHLPPEQRNIGIVFQNYAIFPHMTVFDNIAYGLKMRKTPKSEITRRVEASLDTVGLSGYNKRYQRELSGGEQQRVALARVLVIEPKILLLDEPLSALDKKMREEMKFWIKGLQKDLGITTLYVTHDQNEALTMSDRMAVMSKGHIRQIGSPREVYEHPGSRFVTEFIGESNILSGTLDSTSDGLQTVDLEGQSIQVTSNRSVTTGSTVSFAVRPENIILKPEESRQDLNIVQGNLVAETFQGSLIRYEVTVGNQRIVSEVPNPNQLKNFQENGPITVGWPIEKTALLED